MFLFSCNTKLKNKDLKAGFTLIELMITITIVTLVTGIVMANYSSFNSVVLLKSQAYELALDLRSAQVYGVSVGGTTNSFRGAYGIYFDVANGNQNQYVLFQDQSGGVTRQYDAGEEIGDIYTIDSRFEIFDICTPNRGAEDCSADQASVAFQRPDFDAHIWTNTVPAGDSQIDIKLRSSSNAERERVVTVYSSGQISVQ